MKFERQIFISYAHLDNQPLTPDQLGWVSLFHETLKTLLSQRLGAPVDIWRDDKLRGNDVFADEILQRLAGTALFVSVLTPRYLKSEWCTREIRAFCEQAEAGQSLVVDNKARVIKVLKLPVEGDAALPATVGKLLGYEFFEFDAEDRAPRELDPAYGDRARQAFLRKLNKLAWDLAAQLQRLEASGARPGAAFAPGAGGAAAAPAAGAGAAGPVVFLAECSRDRRAARELIEAELGGCGCTVLPDERLPDDEDEHVAAVQSMLARSVLAVHLVGSGAGRVPDGPGQQPVPVLHNALAAARSREAGLKRVIWLPAGLAAETPAQQAFVEALQHDAALQLGADLVSGDIEQLKAAIHAALKKRAPGPSTREAGEAGTGPPRVLLLCDARDRKALPPLVRALRSRGLEVRLPVFSGDSAEVRQANRELVLGSDALLLVYAEGDEAWKYHQQAELRKLQASERERPLRFEGVLLAPPATDDKELLRALAEPGTLDALERWDEGALGPVVETMALTLGLPPGGAAP